MMTDDETQAQGIATPFDRHLRFIGDKSWDRLQHFSRVRTPPAADRLEVKEDRTGALATLAAHEAWRPQTGAIKPAELDDLDPETEKHMESKMPQFSLRMIGRVERLADPDDVTFEQAEHRVGMSALGTGQDQMFRRHRVEWLEETHLSRVSDRQRWMKSLRDDVRWEHHFCRELKERVSGPLWRHDPDAVEDGVNGD